jgi:uncharacterized metal-binding protein YceD (DUF177 family)
MKVSVKDLRKPVTITIHGDEPWIEAIHSSFALEPDDSCAPGVPGINDKSRRLKGEIRLQMDASGCVSAKGHIAYEPLVPCSRCDLRIPLDVGQEIDALFKPGPHGADDRQEITLSADDLEARFIEDGKVDLEELLNDLVQTAIPFQTCQPDPGTDRCRFCKADLSAPRVFSSGGSGDDDQPVSPFAKLAELKNKK